jgi:hypothetical protein
VAAALGAHLVLDVHFAAAPYSTSDLVVRDVEGARAEARVHVDEQRQVVHVGDAAHVRQHVIQPRDAEIGEPERACRHAASER